VNVSRRAALLSACLATFAIADAGCGGDCGEATYNTPTLGGSIDSTETCGIIGTFVNNGTTATLFPRPEHGNVFAEATFQITATFPGPLAAGMKVSGAIGGTAYYYPPGSTTHRDEATFRTGTISVISFDGDRAELEWDLHYGTGEATSPWYAFSGRDEMSVTNQ